MLSANLTIAASLPDVHIQSRIHRTATGGLPPQHLTLPAGNAGTLTTRSQDDAGVVTLSDGHGIQSGDKVDVYWDGGVRFGMDAGVVGNEINIQSGAGDVLPPVDTAVVLTKQVVIDLEVHTDYLLVIAACSTQRTHLEFRSDTSLLGNQKLAADQTWWYVAGLSDDPFSEGTIEKICASNGSSTDAATLKIGGLYDSTP